MIDERDVNEIVNKAMATECLDNITTNLVRIQGVILRLYKEDENRDNLLAVINNMINDLYAINMSFFDVFSATNNILKKIE